ncbi:MAG TPA: helix-turn-helix domain-containing protein [Acidimicrobiales bacterium]|nr:helix-turn-helix domain-containing protein [Acidimicrobiales bacterium]
MTEDSQKLSNHRVDTFDVLVLGQRLRRARRRAGLTLEQLGALVGRPASYLSQVENGRREPRLTTVGDLAAALGCPVGELLDSTPPDRRAALEHRALRMQEDPRYRALRLPQLRPSARTDDAVLQHLVALFERVVELSEHIEQAPLAGQGARVANAAMRDQMRRADNYFPEIEAVANEAAAAVGTDATAVSERALGELAAHFGFAIARVRDLPPSTRSISDLRNRVIYVSQRNDLPTRAARSVVAQTLGHFALGHKDPLDFEEYVRQRVEANYFAGALLAPERVALPLLARAKAGGDLSVEDVRDVFYISYEMAAHRMTNLLTRHFGVPVHFQRSDPEGVLWKAYENDGVPLPADDDGTIEGQQLCRRWSARRAFESEDAFSLHYQYTDTPAGRYWCVTNIETDGAAIDAVTLGTPAGHARYFRGHETSVEAVSTCPDPSCCRRPRADVARRWGGFAWASARDRSHFVSGLPTDAASFNPFPGVDLVDVYGFLDRRRRI